MLPNRPCGVGGRNVRTQSRAVGVGIFCSDAWWRARRRSATPIEPPPLIRVNELFRIDATAQQRADEGARTGAHDRLGLTGIPTRVVEQAVQHARVIRAADAAARTEHEADARAGR